MNGEYHIQTPRCQLHCLPFIHQPVGTLGRVLQYRHRIQRFAKRRINYLINKLSPIVDTDKQPKDQPSAKPIVKTERLQPGDIVRIRSKNEIRATLNPWNSLKGCIIMEEMWPYCGTTKRVFKRVDRFLDERDYLVKKCYNLVILEGVFCNGTVDFGICDRTCFFFWREEWLEKI